MKLAWATPYNAKSAIARFSAHVVRALIARGHDVTVVRTEVGAAAKLETIAPDTRSIAYDDPSCQREITVTDALIINFGDYFDFHGGALELAACHSSIGVFHDWCLINLFHGWQHHHPSPMAGKKLMHRHYGESAWEMYRSLHGEAFLASAAACFPMTDWLAEKLDGAIVHSRFYQDAVERVCPGPVVYIPLAYPALPVANVSASSMQAKPSERLRLYTLGMVNPNKRVEQVLLAIGRSRRLRDSIAYRVDGAVTDGERKRLEAIALEHGVEFVLNGQVSEDRLAEGLQQADVICCLRYPAVEGASASAIEAMQAGKPVIVTDTAFYAELPDDIVFKVDANNELDELRERLEQLLDAGPAARASHGQISQDWATRRFSAEQYVQALEIQITEVLTAQPYLRVADQVGSEIADLGLRGDDPLVIRMTEQIERMQLPPPADPRPATGCTGPQIKSSKLRTSK